MKERIEALEQEFLKKLESLETSGELEEVRVATFGKKGSLTEILKGMKDLDPKERPLIGQLSNKVRDNLQRAFDEKLLEITVKERNENLAKEFIDISLPGKKVKGGRLHPITETMNFLKDIYIGMGFDIADGPEIEWVENNFDKLNIPKSHPSRDLQDTFYIDDDKVLRTHTSPVQVRYMEERKPPFRMICPGKVYRSDYDVSHTPMFHQMEGLMVGENVSFADLKGILTEFVKRVFGDTKVRFRPHFFPFTEPSAEMDVQCVLCKGAGCRLCKNSGWLEIMGCGMIDPEVLKAVGHNPDEVNGFAFGMGIERITMLRYGIDDLRSFFENDLRLLKQF